MECLCVFFRNRAQKLYSFCQCQSMFTAAVLVFKITLKINHFFFVK